MHFLAEKFMTSDFKDRVEIVHCPELPDCFFEGEKSFQVRGLTGVEISLAREAATVSSDISGSSKGHAALQALTSLRKLLSGLAEDVPSSHILQLRVVGFGAGLDHEVVVRLARDYPITFGILHTRILILTGRGRETLGE